MTKLTLRVTVMSSNGFRVPDDIGQLPGASRPVVGIDELGAVTVAARSTPAAAVPFDQVTSSSAFLPCGIAGASVPTAIFTPAL